jgi:hypothetical protein
VTAGGFVSRVCHEPKVAHAVLTQMLAAYESAGLLRIVRFAEPASAQTHDDQVTAVTFTSTRGEPEFTVTTPCSGRSGTRSGATTSRR